MASRSLHLATKIRVRVAGRLGGLSRSEILTVIDGISERDDFEQCCAAYTSTGRSLPDDPVGGPLGDFLQAMLEWLSSPEGREFLKFILSLFGFVI
jgi:hypothetical protein